MQNVVNLMDALKRSIAQGDQQETPGAIEALARNISREEGGISRA